MNYSNIALALPERQQLVHSLAAHIDQLALSALHEEVSLELKPGLVCPSSQGSHDDMDYALFETSIHAMQGYYATLFEYGFHQQPFQSLQQAGIQCEQRMMRATDQVNTHKGAIFNLGFASAGLGQCFRQNLPLNAENICQQIMLNWQEDLLQNLSRNPNSHGQQMRKKYGISGAIEQVAHGFQIIQQLALPCFQSTLATTGCHNKASVQTLLTLISQLPDTNIVWRGGMSALFIVQEMTQQFLKDGGVLQADWENKLKQINYYFTEHRLSPGGSADLLGITLFFHKVEHELCRDF